jgi:hypothetical protein
LYKKIDEKQTKKWKEPIVDSIHKHKFFEKKDFGEI